MKNFNRRAISVALLIILGAMYSVNASAAQTTSIENSISEMVIAQGQQVMSDLTVQLQQSIAEEINNFSVDLSFDDSIAQPLAWLGEEATAPIVDSIKEGKLPEENLTTKINLLK